jgi:hypothetical protein
MPPILGPNSAREGAEPAKRADPAPRAGATAWADRPPGGYTG